jgi:hypothetical protein
MNRETSEAREVLSATDLVEVRADVHEEPPTEAPTAVAIYYGLELKLPGGNSAALLVCSAHQSTSGFLVKGAKPSDEDGDRVKCPHCGSLHYVVSLADAIEEGAAELGECGPAVLLEAILALALRDAERPAAEKVS